MTDKICTLNSEMIHQQHDHVGLRQQRAIEKIPLVGVPMAKEMGRDNAFRAARVAVSPRYRETTMSGSHAAG